jgi:hypothetical protein
MKLTKAGQLRTFIAYPPVLSLATAIAGVIVDIKSALAEILRLVFNLDYLSYLKNVGRDLYGIRLIQDNHSKVIDCCQIFGPDYSELVQAIKRKGLKQSVCGYCADAGETLNLRNFKGDLIFLSDTFFGLQTSDQYALLFHESCHLVIDAGLEYKHILAPNALSQGKLVREYTQYNGPYSDDPWHTDEWFALLFSASKPLASAYPQHFSSPQNALELSLAYDVLPDN